MAEEGNDGQGISVGLEFNALNHVVNSVEMKGFEMLLCGKSEKDVRRLLGPDGAYL
jgi:hypothetical protein